MADEVFEDDRTTELSTIAAIFPELIIDSSDPYHATLELPVTPLKPLRIKFEQPVADDAPPQIATPPHSTGNGTERGLALTVLNEEEDIQDLQHLPSLKLDINLHEKYPIHDPPRIHIIVDQQWLPRKKVQELEGDCARLWEELGRDQVIYSYIDHLQQQAEKAFGLASDETPVAMRPDLKLSLLDFDLRTKRERFEKETFDCGVCLEPKKGRDCHRLLLCGHVFCTSCLQDFYNNCITEGDVDNVKCMDPTCGKEQSAGPPRKKRKQDRTLNPSELLQIPIGRDLVQRYLRLKRKKKLELDKNTVYCPRQWCQGPAYSSKKELKAEDNFDDFSDSEDDTSDSPSGPPPHSDLLSIPLSERLVVCSDCSYAFCRVCLRTWHGSHSSAVKFCNPRSNKELAEEEAASLDYLKRYSTPCPTCDAPAQKTMGCNHMICFRCKTHFCYLCSSYLLPDNPYEHFNSEKSGCFLRLWELEGGDGEGAANHWAGVGGEGVAWDEDLSSDDEEAAPIIVGEPAAAPQREEDTEDEEPAPDVRRREQVIEIVNFANANAAGRRIHLPDRPAPVNHIPPPAPDPPRQFRMGGGQQANREQRRRNEPPHNRNGGRPQQQPAPLVERHAAPLPENADNNLVPVDDNADDLNEERGELPRAAPGQNNDDAQVPAPARVMGLERFLELARRDAEDEWDSDELDEDEEWGFEDGGRGGVGRVRNAAPGVEGRMARREGRNRWGMRGR